MTPERWFAPEWLQPDRMAQLRARLQDSPQKAVVLDGFLQPDRAALLLDCFERDGDFEVEHAIRGTKGRVSAEIWSATPDIKRFYRYRQVIHPRPGHEMATGYLAHLRFNNALRHPPMRNWFAAVSGLSFRDTVNSYAKAYDPGDFLRKHSDVGPGRQLCLVLYLSRQWEADWGGAFEMYDPDGATVLTVDPLPNRLLLFMPRKGWDHAVAPIHYARATARRYNYTSWFI